MVTFVLEGVTAFTLMLAGLFLITNMDSLGKIASAIQEQAHAQRVHNRLLAKQLGEPDPHQEDEE